MKFPMLTLVQEVSEVINTLLPCRTGEVEKPDKQYQLTKKGRAKRLGESTEVG